MKHLLCLILPVLALAALSSICQADDKREAKPRFKGVELYSWQEKGDWWFVLLNGTNRVKTKNEVKAARNRIKGADNLKREIARLAVGEQVFWTLPAKGFELPPKEVQQAISKVARGAKIDLHIVER
jgi:hypothetical protein